MKMGSYDPGFSKPLIPTGPGPELKIPKGSLPPAEGKPAHLPGEAIKELTNDCCEVKKPGGKHADSPIKDGMAFPDKPTQGPDCDKGANVKPGSVKSGIENMSDAMKEKIKSLGGANVVPGSVKSGVENMSDAMKEKIKSLGGANVVPGSVKSGVENASPEMKKKMELMSNPNITEEMKSRIMMNADDSARYEGMKQIQPE